MVPIGLKKCGRKDTEGGGRALGPLCLCKYATCWIVREQQLGQLPRNTSAWYLEIKQ